MSFPAKRTQLLCHKCATDMEPIPEPMNAVEKYLFDSGFRTFRTIDGKLVPCPPVPYFSTAQSGHLYNAWAHPDGRRMLYGLSEVGMPPYIIEPMPVPEVIESPNGMREYRFKTTHELMRIEQEHGAAHVVQFCFSKQNNT